MIVPVDLTLETPNLADYLESTAVIDFENPSIIQLAQRLADGVPDETRLAQRVYEYVRDQIAHSGDINAREATCSASEVLAKGHGNCCGKSHLLAAILRYLEIPTGFTYQWLVSDDDERLLVLHGLNAVYLKSLERWIRLDARGNKPGVQAELSIASERLAWPVREALGEVDEKVVWVSPKKEVVRELKSNKNRNKISDYWVYKKNTIRSVDRNV